MTSHRASMTLAIAAALLLAAPAAAAERRGSTTIDLGGKAVKRLEAQGVRITAKRPARITKGELRLPVTKGLVTSSAYLNHAGALRLRRKMGKRTRTLSIRHLQARLGGKSRIVADLGRRRLTIFTVKAPRKRLSLNPGFGSASLHGARVSISRAGARAIKRSLDLKRLPTGRFGALTVDALVTGTGGEGSGGGGTGGGGGGGTPGSGGPPVSGPISDAPPLLARPAGAVDLASATVVWTLRDSWIRYVSSERDVEALEGAIPGTAIDQADHPCPDVPASAPPGPLVYSYTLPFAGGWHDHATGTTAVYATGGVRFSFPSHGIDLDVKNLELELTGVGSRAIARFDGRGETNPGNKRAVLVDLQAPTPLPAPGPATLMRATIPTGGSQSVFAGFYGAGDGFGCLTVSYTTP